MMLASLLLLIIPAAWARYHEFSLASEANVIPPGNASFPLPGSTTEFRLSGTVETPGVLRSFRISTLFPASLAFASNPSTTYVSAGRTANISFPSYYGASEVMRTGPVAYEHFTFGSLSLQGQGFLNSPGSSFLGIGFNSGTNDLGFPNFIESLYNQAQLAQKVLAVAFNSKNDATTSSGTVYLGGYNASKAGGPFSQYPVKSNTNYWGYTLTNIKVGNSSLGYNGMLAVDTGVYPSVVPMSVFNLLLQLIFPATIIITISTSNTLQTAGFTCDDTTYSGLPNVTYYLDGQPYVINPYQYIFRVNPGFCQAAFRGALPTYVGPTPFTLGTQYLNTTLSVFDIGNRTMSVAPLNLN